MPYSNGQFEEPDNEDRAGWAASGLTAYAKETRKDPREQVIDHTSDDPDEKEHIEEILSDFLCDVHHLADAAGIDFTEMLERALGHYVEEVEEEKLEAAEAS